MTRDQINHAMMELAGYKFQPEDDHPVTGQARPECWTHPEFETEYETFTPAEDWLKTLDLMIIILEGYPDEVRNSFLDNLLCEVCYNSDAPPDDVDYKHQYLMLTAGPYKICKALLKAFGKWTD